MRQLGEVLDCSERTGLCFCFDLWARLCDVDGELGRESQREKSSSGPTSLLLCLCSLVNCVSKLVATNLKTELESWQSPGQQQSAAKIREGPHALPVSPGAQRVPKSLVRLSPDSSPKLNVTTTVNESWTEKLEKNVYNA